jgi:long-chain acyl-CoA synthetase
MFVCNGKSIYPAEIEGVLVRHPLVIRVVATPVSDSRGFVVPGALIEASASIEKADILNFFIQNGPTYALPRVIKIVSVLPLVGPGKIDRQEARKILEFDYA